MKKLTFRSMLDNLRSSVAGVADVVTGANKFDIDPDENVRAQDFAFSEVSRSGFPSDPTCLAFEPMQRILAIGTRQGSIRLIGRPGVDFHLRPPSTTSNGISTEQAAIDRDALFGNSSSGSSGSSSANAVRQILFLINEGTFVSVTGNSRLHLWTYKTKKPEIVQTLEFQKEALTVCYLPYQSKWMYAGTEKGNVHMVQVDTFSLSGYVINWNKAMELSSRNHPGKVIHLSDCPTDSSKLLIGFDSGLITLWDLKTKAAEQRFQASENLSFISWHFDGKQFVSSQTDGTLAVWNTRGPGKPVSVTTPHARRSKDDPVIPILQVEWKKHRSGPEPLLLFSGGVSFDQKSPSTVKIVKTQTMTIIQGKSTTVLEMEHPIVAFLCIPSQPWNQETCDHEAVIVLLENDLVAIDLVSPGYPLYENPYPMDLHEPPVINCHYMADCPSDIIPTLYTAGAKHKKTNFTDKDWPIDGGQWGAAATGYSDFLLTSHSEGTIRFWDVSSATLQHLDRIKIAKIFERPRKAVPAINDAAPGAVKPDTPPAPVKSSSSVLDGPFDIQLVAMEPECRYLAVACAGGLVILYLWNKQETSSEISVLDIPFRSNSLEINADSGAAVSVTPHRTPPFSAGTTTGSSQQNSLDKTEVGGYGSVRRPRVKAGLHKRAAGYQPILVCNIGCSSSAVLTDHPEQSAPSLITSLALSSKYGLLAVGSDTGLVVVDIIQKHCVINISTPDLYGSDDPYNRGARSPKSEKSPPGAAGAQNHLDLAGGQSSSPAPPSPRHGGAASNSSAGASTNAVKASPKLGSKVDRPKLQRDKSQGPPLRHGRTAVLQRMQSVAHSFESDLNGARRRRGRRGSKDRAIHSSLEKNEFSRSRSSSSSSLDLITSEAILCLTFAETYGRRADTTISPCLWIGTELGSALVLSFQIPVSSSADPSQPQQTTQRLSQPVMGIPTGTLFRYNNSGAVLAMDFLDARGAILSDTNIPVPISSSVAKEDSPSRTARLSDATAVSGSANQPLVNLIADPRHILVICMERQIRTFILPSQGLYQKYKLHQDPSISHSGLAILKASIEMTKENACIYCYLSTGKVAVYSLPSLRPLLEVGISSPNELRIARTLSFGRHGGAVYLISKTELQKVTFSAETTANFSELNGELFTPGREVADLSHRQSVSAPAVGFLKGLMGTNSIPTLTPAQQMEKDREELFGEAAGKASKATARHVPGSSAAAMDHAKNNSNMANSEIGRAKMLAIERGEKLSEIEDTTERMRMQAEAFSGNASQLAKHYKEKKWYQL